MTYRRETRVMSKVTVVVPIYKVENYIEKCIDSVLMQSEGDFQLILVDDGSPDRCPEICDAYAERDSRITVIHKENGGLSSARNAAYPMIQSEFTLFLDSDDYLEKDALAKLLDLQKQDDADVVIGNYWYSYDDHEDLAVLKCSTGNFSGYQALEYLIEGKIQNFAWGKLIRTELLRKYTFPEGKLFEDFFWTHLILTEARSVAIIEKPFVHYRQRTGSISYSFDIKRLDMLEGWKCRDLYLKDNYPELEKRFLRNVAAAYIDLSWLVLTRIKKDNAEGIEKMRAFLQDIPLMNYTNGYDRYLIKSFFVSTTLFKALYIIRKFIIIVVKRK